MINALKEFVKNSVQGLYVSCARDLDLGLGATLVIAPHPDDESLGCGAAIAQLRSRGQPVRIVIVTDGAASGHSAKMGPEIIAATRRAEAENAAAELGVSRENVIFLSFPDAHTEEHIPAIKTALAAQVRAFPSQRVFSPYGIDGHPDHRVVALVIGELYHEGIITCPIYEYPIWFWSSRAVGHLLQLRRMMRLRRVEAREFLIRKKAAITAHQSQYQAPTDEAGWFVFPVGFLARFLTPFELFFEKPERKN